MNTTDLVDWSKLPDWVTEIALDENGELWGFDHYPVQDKNIWRCDPTLTGLQIRSVRLNHHLNWKDSVRSRPKVASLSKDKKRYKIYFESHDSDYPSGFLSDGRIFDNKDAVELACRYNNQIFKRPGVYTVVPVTDDEHSTKQNT